MRHSLSRGFIAIGIFAFAAGFAGSAQAQSECAAAKIKAASRKAKCLAVLEAGEAASNEPADPGKVEKCSDKFSAAFAKAEGQGGCSTTGDAAAIEAKVDAFVGSLAAALDVSDPPEPNACEEAKLRAAAKKTDCKLKLKAGRAANPRFPPNPFRMPKCHDRFNATFAKLEEDGGCNTLGDAEDIEALVDAFVDDIDQLAPPLESGCSPVPVETLHGPPELFFGNSRLALIEHGKVPCLHTEKITKAKCRFLGDASGAWLESTQGSFALAGQPISRRGDPDGEYVIASEVNEDLTVPCIEPSGGDMTGTSTGQELAVSCAVEVLLATKNALGYPLENYATREVCTSSFPHPDAPGPTFLACHGGENEPQYCCYTGRGAALNDPTGRERGPDGAYLIGASHYCHVGDVGGYQVYVAKRPATRNFPPPRQVVKNSPLAWRPLSPLFGIAN